MPVTLDNKQGVTSLPLSNLLLKFDIYILLLFFINESYLVNAPVRPLCIDIKNRIRNLFFAGNSKEEHF